MNFFSECKTPDEAKDRYRDLAKEYHPDKGGDAEVMKEINRQYDAWDFPRSQQNSDEYYSGFKNTSYGMPGSGYKYGSPGGYNQKYYEQRANQHLYDEIAGLKRDLEFSNRVRENMIRQYLEGVQEIKELKKKIKAYEKQKKEPTKPKKPIKMRELKKDSVIHL